MQNILSIFYDDFSSNLQNVNEAIRKMFLYKPDSTFPIPIKRFLDQINAIFNDFRDQYVFDKMNIGNWHALTDLLLINLNYHLSQFNFYSIHIENNSKIIKDIISQYKVVITRIQNEVGFYKAPFPQLETLPKEQENTLEKLLNNLRTYQYCVPARDFFQVHNIVINSVVTSQRTIEMLRPDPLVSNNPQSKMKKPPIIEIDYSDDANEIVSPDLTFNFNDVASQNQTKINSTQNNNNDLYLQQLMNQKNELDD